MLAKRRETETFTVWHLTVWLYTPGPNSVPYGPPYPLLIVKDDLEAFCKRLFWNNNRAKYYAELWGKVCPCAKKDR